MNKREREIFQQNKEIPENVKKKLVMNREKIKNNDFKQRNYIPFKKVVLSMAMVAILFIVVIANPQINSAIKEAFGISKDVGVSTLENKGIEDKIDITSTKDNIEIRVTKFISTKNKYAFDYQFEIKDEQLENLLKKNLDRNSNTQLIDFQLFEEGNSTDLNGGMFYVSTFRVEGNMFYGSVISSFINEKIPNDSKLTLVINKLTWQDIDEVEAAKNAALLDPNQNPFGVDPVLEYVGDWTYPIKYSPIKNTSIPEISSINNIHNIEAKSDALQTSIQFTAPIDTIEKSKEITKFYSTTIYRNGVEDSEQLSTETWDPVSGKFKLSINLSSLDKESRYKVQVNEINNSNGEAVKEIGSFELQNQ